MTPANLKLRIDPVPTTCWGQNLRKQIKKSQWAKLREKVCADQGNVCCVCEAPGNLKCHEAWSYADERRIQRLMGFQAVCSMCHHVTHFGLAQILARKGHLNLDAVIEHFLNVNGVGRDEFDAHKTEAFRLWRERSEHDWHTDLGEWASLVKLENADPDPDL